MALQRVWIPSPNYSDRGGTKVRLIVVHTAEGATTYQSLGSFFGSSSSGVSSHTGIDDTPNTVGEYVKRDRKAWTQANANPYSVATELCAFASWTSAEWDRHPTMLSNCAAWIAEEAAHFGIPLVRLNASQAQGGQAGVCGHNELGTAGGNHWDPGPNFPWQRVMDMAKGGGSPAPPDEETMVAVSATVRYRDGQKDVFQVGKNGRLYHKWSKATGQWNTEDVMSKANRASVQLEPAELGVNIAGGAEVTVVAQGTARVWYLFQDDKGGGWGVNELP